MNKERINFKEELSETAKSIIEKYSKKQIHIFLVDDDGFDYIYHKDTEKGLSEDSQTFVNEIERMFWEFVAKHSGKENNKMINAGN